MNIFVVVPTKVYALDVIFPLLVQLKASHPDLKAHFIFFHASSWEKLRLDKTMEDLVYELGKPVLAFDSAFLEKRAKPFNRALKFLSLVPTWLRMLFSRKSILLQPRRLETAIDKFMRALNGICGKTYCFLMATTPMTESLVQYYDEKGEVRAGISKNEKVWDVGDGLLAYDPSNFTFLERQGYRKIKVIGYPLLFEAYQNYLKRSFKTYVKEETGEDLDPENTVTIFYNKYYRGVFARDDAWALNALAETIRVVREKLPDSHILIRTHPMLPKDKVEMMLKSIQVPRVRRSFLNVYVLAHASRFSVSIGHSTCVLQALGCGKAALSYGRQNDHFYSLYPEGSPYLEFGVKVALDPEGLRKFIDGVACGETGVEAYRKKTGGHEDLSLFDSYWEKS